MFRLTEVERIRYGLEIELDRLRAAELKIELKLVPDTGPGQSASPRPIERICDDIRGAETVLAQRFDVERAVVKIHINASPHDWT